jgi:tRNA-dihydrouridine synthase 1
LKAAKLVENDCDAIDINLGCPQDIARRGRSLLPLLSPLLVYLFIGHYGSYLQDEWDLIHKMITTLRIHLKTPVTCKIRVFADVEKSIRYAKMIESAGAHLLTVHGRTRDQKGHNTGLADWEQIKRIKYI